MVKLSIHFFFFTATATTALYTLSLRYVLPSSYMGPNEVELFFHVSAKRSADNTSAERFLRRIFEAFHEMREVLSHALPDKPESKPKTAAASS